MTLIESESPRNVKQLVYLSGKKHERTQKIRFTLNPLFGFIFFISGKNKNHICWELLNSHATYIWSFNKELSIESQIELSELNIIANNEQIGHDLLLTMNGHGVGFWDRPQLYPNGLNVKLSEVVRDYPEIEAYVFNHEIHIDMEKER